MEEATSSREGEEFRRSREPDRDFFLSLSCPGEGGRFIRGEYLIFKLPVRSKLGALASYPKGKLQSRGKTPKNGQPIFQT